MQLGLGRGPEVRSSLATRPAFWLMCAAVFSVNALVAASRHEWLLVLSEAVTAVLALTAAWALPAPGRNRD